MGWDHYRLNWLSKTDEITIAKTKRKAFVLKLHHLKNTNILVEAMNELSKDNWLWLNVFIAMRFQVKHGKNELIDAAGNNWTPEDLWEKYLSRMTDFIS